VEDEKTKETKIKINEAMELKKKIVIHYDGGKKSEEPKVITPVSWKSDHLFQATFSDSDRLFSWDILKVTKIEDHVAQENEVEKK